MSWKNVEKRCRKLHENHKVNCKIPNERSVIVKLIADEFPYLSQMRICEAVDLSTKKCAQPVNSNVFITYVQELLK